MYFIPIHDTHDHGNIYIHVHLGTHTHNHIQHHHHKLHHQTNHILTHLSIISKQPSIYFARYLLHTSHMELNVSIFCTFYQNTSVNLHNYNTYTSPINTNIHLILYWSHAYTHLHPYPLLLPSSRCPICNPYCQGPIIRPSTAQRMQISTITSNIYHNPSPIPILTSTSIEILVIFAPATCAVSFLMKLNTEYYNVKGEKTFTISQENSLFKHYNHNNTHSNQCLQE